MPIICHLCEKKIKEEDRMVAYAEVTGTFYTSSVHGEYESYVDDIEPKEDWSLVHYNCFFKKKERKGTCVAFGTYENITSCRMCEDKRLCIEEQERKEKE